MHWYGVILELQNGENLGFCANLCTMNLIRAGPGIEFGPRL